MSQRERQSEGDDALEATRGARHRLKKGTRPWHTCCDTSAFKRKRSPVASEMHLAASRETLWASGTGCTCKRAMPHVTGIVLSCRKRLIHANTKALQILLHFALMKYSNLCDEITQPCSLQDNETLFYCVSYGTGSPALWVSCSPTKNDMVQHPHTHAHNRRVHRWIPQLSGSQMGVRVLPGVREGTPGGTLD